MVKLSRCWIRWTEISNFFFFNDTATTEIYTLSLHDALPISREPDRSAVAGDLLLPPRHPLVPRRGVRSGPGGRRPGVGHCRDAPRPAAPEPPGLDGPEPPPRARGLGGGPRAREGGFAGGRDP